MSKIYLVDIDGTICEDIPNEESERFPHAVPLKGALDWVRRFAGEGEVWFFTSRRHKHKKVTEKWLREHGFPFKGVLYGKPQCTPNQEYHWVDSNPVQATWVQHGLEKI